jgi:uncharacterized membrane protein (UPF0182 family)
VTPKERQNLAALISASYVDGKPTLELLELGKDSPVPGPTQAQQRMENNTDARTQLNIWAKNGVKGNLLSLPYGGGMLYVQPIYLKSSGERSYPQLQRVLLNFGDRTAFAENVPAGIAQLVGTGAPPVVQPPNNQPPTGSGAVARRGSEGQPGHRRPSRRTAEGRLRGVRQGPRRA